MAIGNFNALAPAGNVSLGQSPMTSDAVNEQRNDVINMRRKKAMNAASPLGPMDILSAPSLGSYSLGPLR